MTADRAVDVSDLGVLATHYGTSAGASYDRGDLNRDGRVDVADLGILATNFGRRAARATAAAPPAPSARPAWTPQRLRR